MRSKRKSTGFIKVKTTIAFNDWVLRVFEPRVRFIDCFEKMWLQRGSKVHQTFFFFGETFFCGFLKRHLLNASDTKTFDFFLQNWSPNIWRKKYLNRKTFLRLDFLARAVYQSPKCHWISFMTLIWVLEESIDVYEKIYFVSCR